MELVEAFAQVQAWEQAKVLWARFDLAFASGSVQKLQLHLPVATQVTLRLQVVQTSSSALDMPATLEQRGQRSGRASAV